VRSCHAFRRCGATSCQAFGAKCLHVAATARPPTNPLLLLACAGPGPCCLLSTWHYLSSSPVLPRTSLAIRQGLWILHAYVSQGTLLSGRLGDVGQHQKLNQVHVRSGCDSYLNHLRGVLSIVFQRCSVRFSRSRAWPAAMCAASAQPSRVCPRASDHLCVFPIFCSQVAWAVFLVCLTLLVYRCGACAAPWCYSASACLTCKSLADG